MKAFASLHSVKPSSQADHEITYEGYHRVELDFTEDFGSKTLTLLFPTIGENAPGLVAYIAIGANQEGDGPVALLVETIPNIALVQGRSPKVIIANLVADKNGEIAGQGLPINVHPIARMIHALITGGQMTAEELHPQVYEVFNDELAKHGIPVVPVMRSGAAKMIGTMSNMPSLREFSNGLESSH